MLAYVNKYFKPRSVENYQHTDKNTIKNYQSYYKKNIVFALFFLYYHQY